MPSAQCLLNVSKEIPPRYCEHPYCEDQQARVNKYCKHAGLNADIPVPQVDDKGDCWCCCSCFAYYTQIGVKRKGKTKFQFKMIQDIVKNEKVIATNAAVDKWEEKEVTDVSGIAPEVEVDFMYYSRFITDKEVVVQLITTADHLFLQPDGKLMPMQDLRPGDKVRTADGGEATVQMTANGQYSGGVRHISLGAYKKGDPLDGHLINSEGVITADFSVQVAHYSGNLDQKLYAKNRNEPPVGSSAHLAKYGQGEYLEFINDPSRWPRFFTPLLESLINVPISALSYFAADQAADIEEAEGPQDPGNSAPLAKIRYLFTVYSAWFKDVYFIIDWKNEVPNAWYFMDYQQRYIVVSGGLVRLSNLNRDGMAVILSHLVAQNKGIGCSAEADYEGVLLYLRQIWNNDLFFKVAEAGIKQVNAVFDMIKTEHQHEDPDNICARPSIDCRREALHAGLVMDELPQCAMPKPDFAVIAAKANKELTEVTVDFNRDLNEASATFTDNYVLTPEATITDAVLKKKKQNQVVLKTEGLLPDSTYELSVMNVVSAGGYPLAPDSNKVSFSTTSN
jgi:hypothetical protein